MSKKSIKDKPAEPATWNIHGANVPGDPQRNPPIFSLWHMQSPYCVKDCQQPARAAFATKLRELSQLTWMQILEAPRHGSGYEKISRSSMNVRIPANITEDVNIIAFRFCGMAPMIGYRDPFNKSIFHIVWVDPNCKVYNH